MSFWRRLFGGEAAEDEQAPAAALPKPAPPTESERALSVLRRATTSKEPNPAEVEEALRRLVGSESEREALALVQQLPNLTEDVRLLAARAANERGDPDWALQLLGRARSVGALLLQADLHTEAGQLGSALSLVERVLMRDYDTPGARERHRRLVAAVRSPPKESSIAAHAGATVMGGVEPAAAAAFRLEGEAGRGGAGTVYRAFDDSLGRPLAFKLYHRPELPQEREKLLREARFASRFAGPGVLRVFDAQPEAGWLALEWAAGGSLRGLLNARDEGWLLPLGAWLEPLLAALARFHDAGLVHADLKPGNVLFRAPAEPVLSDFGITAAVGERASGGSLGYLSAERLDGAPLERADDVYAVGRMIEDALEVFGAALPADRLLGWTGLAADCMAPVQARLADAHAVSRRLRALLR